MKTISILRTLNDIRPIRPDRSLSNKKVSRLKGPAVTILAALFLFLTACQSVDVVLNRHTDPLEMKRLALFRIQNVRRRTGDKITDLLTIEFLRYGYNLIERAKLEQIIRELKLGRSGLVNTARAVEVGKLAGADTVILGNAEVPYKTPNELKHLVLKCIDVETGAVILAVQLKREMDIDEAIPRMIREMHQKVLQYRLAHAKKNKK